MRSPARTAAEEAQIQAYLNQKPKIDKDRQQQADTERQRLLQAGLILPQENPFPVSQEHRVLRLVESGRTPYATLCSSLQYAGFTRVIDHLSGEATIAPSLQAQRAKSKNPKALSVPLLDVWVRGPLLCGVRYTSTGETFKIAAHASVITLDGRQATVERATAENKFEASLPEFHDSRRYITRVQCFRDSFNIEKILERIERQMDKDPNAALPSKILFRPGLSSVHELSFAGKKMPEELAPLKPYCHVLPKNIKLLRWN